MTAATHHRGPDATACHLSLAGKAKIYFGHNRLKIIDPSDSANQPFFSADGRYLLLYNGEIYNYRELKKNLQERGCYFGTQSDTEVILHLLILDGQRGLAQLNGMFALAFYDTQEHRLLLARDRFGIKPLFYTDTDDYFIVSSQIQGILQSGLIPKILNQNQVYHYLQYKHAAKPHTFYQHVLELSEGNVLHWEKDKTKVCSYVNPALTNNRADDAIVTQQVEDLLMASVLKHLVADVSVGLFLSGGIDSTLLLALLHKAGHRHFPAFTITHPASAGSFGTADAHFASLAARQYEAEHTCFEIKENILAGTDAWVQALDQPIADSAGLLTSYLSEKVKPYIKVALSGAGADELFGGYNRHRAFYLYWKRRHLVSAFRLVMPAFTPLLPTGFDHPLRKQFLLLRKLAYKLQKNPRETFLNFTAMDQAVAELWQQEKAVTSTANNTPDKPADWLRWTLQHDQQHYLISDVLAITDQSSMRQSLEIRTPYLENNISAYLSGLDSEIIFRGGSKWILKEILEAQNGQAFLRRSKEGFGLPLGNWLRNPQNHYLFTELQNPQHLLFEFINFIQTQKLLQSHWRQRQDFSTEIWALIVLAKWLQHNFG